MAIIIELTEDGGPRRPREGIFINIDYILYFTKGYDNDKVTNIALADNNKTPRQVIESPAEIVEKIRTARAKAD